MNSISKLAVFGSLLGLSLANPVNAAITLVSESFDYPDGNLAGNNTGTGFSDAWGSGNFTVLNGAAYSNPNSSTQNSTQNRSLNGFSETTFTLSLDYTVVANVEGSYDFHVVLLDDSGQTLFSLGNRNNQGSTGEFYVARLGTNSAGNAQSAYKLGGSETFSDTMTVDFSISGTSVTANLSSVAFPSMNTVLNRSDFAAAIDFTSGGTLRIEKSGLDGMQITTDNILITAVPEPSSSILMAMAGCTLLVRRRR
ncbi:PEP-CTERM sorting domain-containing protein [Verrucomicrobiaceae bacterium N1E253]|uniref:PEP-CTERM sorting domain-containing protein n=1 Tax=Oceaniferula marina TaxID=2748318 RepID=A0A851GID3_9BACT|nr:PEP-CTERM sorting domain-containing protein [Oceaniferula marina]NWK54380.1 PEP-CTERM sorting domain-containing protein [Oceaniferula marina]